MNLNNRIIRNMGAVGFLSMLGLTAAMIPISLFTMFTGHSPSEPFLYVGASFLAGGVIGWVLRR